MLFSRSTEYAIRTLVYLAMNASESHRIGIKKMAKDLGFPEHFLGKILQDLAKKRVVVSSKGPHGGFYMDDDAKNRSIISVVEIIDGLGFFDQCGLGLCECNEDKPCPIHKNYQIFKGDLFKLLSEKTINDMKEDLIKGVAFMNFE